MITKEDLDKCHEDAEIDELFEKLLQERDEALRRVEAYRDTAYKFHQDIWEIDREAAKILEREAKSKEGKIMAEMTKYEAYA